MRKDILKEDIKDLEYLIKKYIKENKYDKASECKKELEEIKDKMKKC